MIREIWYAMDYEKTAASDIIQKKWSGGFGLHVQGYVYGTGRVLLCDCKKIKSGKSLSTSVSVAGESTLDSILASEEDPWVDLTECDSKNFEDKNIRLSCGEGAMGNEGYVAVSDLNTKRLIWMAFFTCSNPLTEIKFENETIIAENTYEQEWVFPVLNPEALTIRAAGAGL
jgi:hypothetical protein